MSCRFCAIIAGEADAYRVFEDEVSLAFLDTRPLFPGHCLLLPKRHYEVLTDLPGEVLRPLFQNAQLLARAVETAMQAEGSFVAINNRVSQSVPHLHIHVVPRRRNGTTIHPCEAPRGGVAGSITATNACAVDQGGLAPTYPPWDRRAPARHERLVDRSVLVWSPTRLPMR